jgi:hypothetical protein
MPNGLSHDPQWNDILAGYEVFFAPINTVLTAFAADHNLLLEKYYHDAPCWSLRFAHPSSGEAKVDICRGEDSKAKVSGVWWCDDYDTFTRSLRYSDEIRCEPIPEIVQPALLETLKVVVAFERGKWSQVATGYRDIWKKTWTKSQFEKLTEGLPKPKLD